MIPDTNENTAHVRYSVECFNAAWDLIERKDRSEDDNLRMLDLAHSSLWHWREREDCTNKNLAIGYWQLSRIYAIIGHADLARIYAAQSLSVADKNDAFNRAFAYEAIARAEMVAGNREAMNENLGIANALAEQIQTPEDAAWLRQNLNEIRL